MLLLKRVLLEITFIFPCLVSEFLYEPYIYAHIVNMMVFFIYFSKGLNFCLYILNIFYEIKNSFMTIF